MLKFRWVGGLEIRGCSNRRMKKKSSHPKNKHFNAYTKMKQNLFQNQKGFFMLFRGDVKLIMSFY